MKLELKRRKCTVIVLRSGDARVIVDTQNDFLAGGVLVVRLDKPSTE